MDSFYEKDDFNQDDIQKAINEKYEESLRLDFKAAGSLENTDSKKREISKDVSSFANSAGGIIIYGIKEDDHKADSFDFINGREITKEWIEHVIDSNINRRIPDLVIYPIRFDDDLEKSIYLIKIPESFATPHMASDKRYYRRYNFQSVPMEEYEVRNLFNKKQVTKLIIDKLLISQKGIFSSGGHLNWIDYEIIFQVRNISNAIEDRCKLEVYIPVQLYKSGHPEYNPLNEFLIRTEGEFSVFSIPYNNPIFQNELTSIASTTLRFTNQNLNFAREPGLQLRLYYSNGIDELPVNLGSLLSYNNNELTTHSFNS